MHQLHAIRSELQGGINIFHPPGWVGLGWAYVCLQKVLWRCLLLCLPNAHKLHTTNAFS